MSVSFTDDVLFELRPFVGENMFSRDESISSHGAYLAAEVDVAPLFLVEEFGPPAKGDGIRVSGQYTFCSADGAVFTVHDYKMTTLWTTEEGLPAPADFWKLRIGQEFSIGSRGTDTKDFSHWLLSRYRAWLAKQR